MSHRQLRGDQCSESGDQTVPPTGPCVLLTVEDRYSECDHFIGEDTKQRDLPRVTQQLSLWQTWGFRACSLPPVATLMATPEAVAIALIQCGQERSRKKGTGASLYRTLHAKAVVSGAKLNLD